MNDHSFLEVLTTVRVHIANPTVYCFQKFTCQHCGNRLTMEEPNTFFTDGSCDRCQRYTDIWRSGMNIMIVVSTDNILDHKPLIVAVTPDRPDDAEIRAKLTHWEREQAEQMLGHKVNLQ